MTCAHLLVIRGRRKGHEDFQYSNTSFLRVNIYREPDDVDFYPCTQRHYRRLIYYLILHSYMFRSYDHHQEENILLSRTTQVTLHRLIKTHIIWSHACNRMQTPQIKYTEKLKVASSVKNVSLGSRSLVMHMIRKPHSFSIIHRFNFRYNSNILYIVYCILASCYIRFTLNICSFRPST
jgi:hypothetical protein